jgi:hypothetical protein
VAARLPRDRPNQEGRTNGREAALPARGDGLTNTVGLAVEALGPTAECPVGECFVGCGLRRYVVPGVDDGEMGDVMARSKADRSAAAKKGAATRERNRKKAKSEAAGKKAAGTRQSREAGELVSRAKRAAGAAMSGAASAVRLAGQAVRQGGKAIASKAGGAQRGRGKK